MSSSLLVLPLFTSISSTSPLGFRLRSQSALFPLFFCTGCKIWTACSLYSCFMSLGCNLLKQQKFPAAYYCVLHVQRRNGKKKPHTKLQYLMFCNPSQQSWKNRMTSSYPSKPQLSAHLKLHDCLQAAKASHYTDKRQVMAEKRGHGARMSTVWNYGIEQRLPKVKCYATGLCVGQS